jgi:hypothetical protein
VSFETSAPYTSARCAAISPVVSPFAAREITSSSTPASRRCRFFTIWGSNDPSRSRGTAISTSPTSVSTVFDRAPLRELLVSRPSGALVVLHLHLERRLQYRLRQIREQTARANQLDPLPSAPARPDLWPAAHPPRPSPRSAPTHQTLRAPFRQPPAGKSGPRSYTVNRTVPGILRLPIAEAAEPRGVWGCLPIPISACEGHRAGCRVARANARLPGSAHRNSSGCGSCRPAS